jgi:1-phosphofructokinase
VRPAPRTMNDRRSEVCVFASSLLLTISIERSRDSDGGDELHFHPGGQGFWIARMLARLGASPTLVAPVGGESGEVLRGLVRTWNVELQAVPTVGECPAYVHDRRQGTREQLAQTRLPTLDRHELDDLYGSVLACATAAGTAVVTGRFPGDPMPVDLYRRLGADLRATGTTVVGDLHGEELRAFLDGGELHTLKVSDDDLVEDGVLPRGATLAQRLAAIGPFLEQGVERVVLSAADGPTILGTRGTRYRARAPVLETVDHRGSGDAMTAGLAYAVLQGLDAKRTIELACAAGAANATRHGLGNADAELVHSLAGRVEVQVDEVAP